MDDKPVLARGLRMDRGRSPDFALLPCCAIGLTRSNLSLGITGGIAYFKAFAFTIEGRGRDGSMTGMDRLYFAIFLQSMMCLIPTALFLDPIFSRLLARLKNPSD